MSSYPPPPPPVDWKQQRRLYRDQARAQRDLYRVQARAARRGSILGPLLVIFVGVVFLLNRTGHIRSAVLWDWYGRWWPYLLIFLGLILLLEWSIDQWLNHRYQSFPATSALPYPVAPARRSLGGGVVLLLLLLIGAGILYSATSYTGGGRALLARSFNLDQDNLDEFLGDRHESDQTLTQAVPADAALSIDNPRGDVILSGTSADGQLHVSAHRQVFSRSDAEAEMQGRRLNARIGSTGAQITLYVPAVEGARVDLSVLLPSSVSLNVTARRGDIRVSSMRSTLSLIANHGDTDVSAIVGRVSVRGSSSSGSISSHNLTGALTIDGRWHDLTLSDINGPVDVSGDFFGTTHLERLAGAFHFHTSRTDLRLASLPGELEISPNADLSVTHATGPLAIQTRNRNIRLDGISGETTVSDHNGSIDLAAVAPLGNISVENRNGSVSLTLPSTAGFHLDAETTGELSNDFSLPTKETGDRKSTTGTVGSGAAVIRVVTSHADVSIRKASADRLPAAPVLPGIAPDTSTHGDEGGITVGKNGVRIIGSTDGDSVTIDKSGLRMTNGHDGSTVIAGKDGLRVSVNPDGCSIYHASNGTQLTENADGTQVFAGRDGTHYTRNADGTQIYTGPDGTSITIGADGHLSARGSDGQTMSAEVAAKRLQGAREEVRRAEHARDAERRQKTVRTEADPVDQP